ncbi:hypothetical protein [Bartonella koehlerae]|uniref:Phage related protein n=1 Tax=Bartonella koehlerae C-29 TaxID=1134510 RepID=A0A067WFE2_9HYPH|nr:hypothetical protein [Bartonella koehlerae]KEC54632.1 hypothetical protein O9A_01246 [Bartonella koehlerae C-29]
MSINEVLWVIMIVVLLFSGVILRFALYYRDQAKAFQEEARNIKHEFLRDSIKITEERDRAIREQNMVIKRRDQAIAKLKRQVKQYEEVMQQHQEKIKSKDEAKK